MSGTGMTSDRGTTQRDNCPVWTEPCIGCTAPGCRREEIIEWVRWFRLTMRPSTLETLTSEVYPL